MNDFDIDGIIMIGEIGGGMEVEVVCYIKEYGIKFVVGFIVGQIVFKGCIMGYVGVIIGGVEDIVEVKMKIMEECGLYVVKFFVIIGEIMKKVLQG